MVKRFRVIASSIRTEEIGDKAGKKVIQNLNGKGSWRSSSPNSKLCITHKPHLQGSPELVWSLLEHGV